jgi:hypothetical protein
MKTLSEKDCRFEPTSPMTSLRTPLRTSQRMMARPTATTRP